MGNIAGKSHKAACLRLCLQNSRANGGVRAHDRHFFVRKFSRLFQQQIAHTHLANVVQHGCKANLAFDVQGYVGVKVKLIGPHLIHFGGNGTHALCMWACFQRVVHRGKPHKPVDTCPHQMAALKDIGNLTRQHTNVPFHIVRKLAGLARARIKAVDELHHAQNTASMVVKGHNQHGFCVVARGLVKIVSECKGQPRRQGTHIGKIKHFAGKGGITGNGMGIDGQPCRRIGKFGCGIY